MRHLKQIESKAFIMTLFVVITMIWGKLILLYLCISILVMLSETVSNSGDFAIVFAHSKLVYI